MSVIFEVISYGRIYFVRVMKCHGDLLLAKRRERARERGRERKREREREGGGGRGVADHESELSQQILGFLGFRI